MSKEGQNSRSGESRSRSQDSEEMSQLNSEEESENTHVSEERRGDNYIIERLSSMSQEDGEEDDEFTSSEESESTDGWQNSDNNEEGSKGDQQMLQQSKERNDREVGSSEDSGGESRSRSNEREEMSQSSSEEESEGTQALGGHKGDENIRGRISSKSQDVGKVDVDSVSREGYESTEEWQDSVSSEDVSEGEQNMLKQSKVRNDKDLGTLEEMVDYGESVSSEEENKGQQSSGTHQRDGINEGEGLPSLYESVSSETDSSSDEESESSAESEDNEGFYGIWSSTRGSAIGQEGKIESHVNQEIGELHVD